MLYIECAFILATNRKSAPWNVAEWVESKVAGGLAGVMFPGHCCFGIGSYDDNVDRRELDPFIRAQRLGCSCAFLI